MFTRYKIINTKFPKIKYRLWDNVNKKFRKMHYVEKARAQEDINVLNIASSSKKNNYDLQKYFRKLRAAL